MTTPSTHSDEAQPIEDVSAQSKTMPTTKQPVGKRKQDEADANSKTTPMKRRRVVPAVNPSTNLWKEICKSGSEFFNKAQEYFDVAATNDNISLEDLARRIAQLQQAVQQQHQHALLTPLPSPIQKLLEAVQCSLRTTSKCLSITMENMKQALTNRMDEMEQEIHNIRAEIQPTNIEPLQRDIESVNQRITLLKEDIMKELRGIRETHSQYSKKADATGPAEGIEDLDIVDSITDRSDDDSDRKSPRREDSTVEEHPADRLARDQPKKTSTNTSGSSMTLPRGKDREQKVGRTEGKPRKPRSNSPSRKARHRTETPPPQRSRRNSSSSTRQDREQSSPPARGRTHPTPPPTRRSPARRHPTPPPSRRSQARRTPTPSRRTQSRRQPSPAHRPPDRQAPAPNHRSPPRHQSSSARRPQDRRAPSPPRHHPSPAHRRPARGDVPSSKQSPDPRNSSSSAHRSPTPPRGQPTPHRRRGQTSSRSPTRRTTSDDGHSSSRKRH